MKNIVILGSSGDLASRKLFPALFKLREKDFMVTGYSRTLMNEEEFKSKLKKFCSYSLDFLERIKYISGEYSDTAKLKSIQGDLIYYLSLPPQTYSTVLNYVVNVVNKAKIVLEKPFGFNLESFLEIKNMAKLCKKNIYLIDHYLYKPISIAINKIFATNPEFKNVIHSKNIKRMEIIFKEIIGAEGRTHFDKNGIVNDVVQNHMAEILGIILSKGETTRAEIFKSIQGIDSSDCLFGQYDSYKNEFRGHSSTKTFCIIPIRFKKNTYWEETSIKIIAGKGLDEKKFEVRIQMKCESYSNLFDLLKKKQTKSSETTDIHENIDSCHRVFLVISCSPISEIFIEVFENKQIIKKYVLYDEDTINSLSLDLYMGKFGYEAIFNSLLEDQNFESVMFDEAEILWKIFDPQNFKDSNLIFYKKGSNISEIVGIARNS